MGKFKFPSAYTILFFLIAVVAVLTWIVPAGQYHMAMNEALGKEVPVAGGHMFETVEVKEAVAEKKKAIKEESKRRNMFGSKRDGSFWRNKKRTVAK